LIFQQSCEAGDYWDDEWDDDSEGGGTQTPAWTNNAMYSSGQVPKSGSAGDVSSIGVCTDLNLVMLCHNTAISVTQILKYIKVKRKLSLYMPQEHMVMWRCGGTH
jgi:hypothetical protein